MNTLRKVGFWHWIFWITMAFAGYATFIRFWYGLGAVSNMSDQFPWGVWVGFDVMCGVALAAGGFTIAAVVHVFNIKKYKPIARPAILTAFLGYSLVVLALMFDLGKPYNIWHPLVMWNPRSVMFEVGWCVTLYSVVLGLEFLPAVLERFHLDLPLRLLKKIMIPLVIAGCILSTLHQSSLGSLFLIVPHKLHPLWYTDMLPVQFLFSAICVGLAMTIFESWHSAKAFGRHLEMDLLNGLARVLAVALSGYLALRFLDLYHRGVLPLLSQPTREVWFFGLEILLLAVPAALLYRDHVRSYPPALYGCSVAVVFGVITNRLNVGITGMERASGVSYTPRWTEIAITLGIVALGFAIFRFAARNLPILGEEKQTAVPASTVTREMAPSFAQGD
jgi:Ni/Fe-hydrogenase subunit HybB-like protein